MSVIIDGFMKASMRRAAGPPASLPVRRTRQWPILAALCGVTLLAYANSFHSGFVLDNRGILLRDPRIREATAQNLSSIFRHTYWWPYGESGLYRPLTTLTYLFNYAILGNADRPAGYHWINFLLHAGNVLLVYALARRLFRDIWPGVLPCAWMAALWAVHPVLTESVANIVGRADLLAAMALLGGFFLYLKSAEAKGWPRLAWLAALAAAMVLGVFAKETVATLPGVIVLYELTWWKERRKGRVLLAGLAAMAVALELMWSARAAVFQGLPAARFPYWDNPLVDAGFWTARLTALKIVARYLGLLAWPGSLSCDYSYARIPLASGAVEDWLAWLAVAAVAATVVVLYRWNRPLFFLAGMAAVSFLPTSNLLFPIGTNMAERFLYMPAIAWAAAAVWACYALAGKAGGTRWASAALALIVAACAVRTWARNADWRDDLSLANSAVAVSPASFKSHKLLAAALYDSDAGHSNIDRVLAETEKSLAILDPVADWHNNADSYRRAGGYYLTKGDMHASPDESRKAYRRSLELFLRARSIVSATIERAAQSERVRGAPAPQADEARMADLELAISGIQLKLGDPQQALDAALAAQRMNPADAESYRRLSAAYLTAGRPDDAAVALIEGALVTSDQELRREAMRLYREGLDPQGCAIKPGPYGPAIDPSCPVVQRHLCAASAAALQVYARLGRQDLVEKLKASAGPVAGCR